MKVDKIFWVIIGFAVLVVVGALGYGAMVAYNNPRPARELPYFKPLSTDTVSAAKGVIETQYHTIPAFSFTNQRGNLITQDSMKGKVAVVDFFFTTCGTICPVMTGSLKEVAAKYGAKKDFVILSHTVDPETDTVAQMVAYAKEKGITQTNWHLLTGDKAALYLQAREGYFLDASIGDGGPDDFVHTQLFALVDKKGHIRGYYDGTDAKDMKRLDIDLGLLFQYYEWEAKEASNMKW